MRLTADTSHGWHSVKSEDKARLLSSKSGITSGTLLWADETISMAPAKGIPVQGWSLGRW